jgi:hypothetical protein
MSDIVQLKSIAELIDEKSLFKSLSWTAGGASDNAVWTGDSIDREAFATGSLPRSLDAVVAYDATLASGATLALAWDLQDSPDGTNYSDLVTEASTVVATGPSGGGRVHGVSRIVIADANKPMGTPGYGIGGARRYVRVNVTPHLSAAGTDTGVIAGVGVFGGFDQLAAPQT